MKGVEQMCQPDIASVSRYKTNLKSCNCPDAIYRPWRQVCKHRAALLDAVGVLTEWQDSNPGVELMAEWSEIKNND